MSGLFKFLTCGCLSDKKKKDGLPPVIFVFGTLGSGKHTVGSKLAETIGYTYLNLSKIIENEISNGTFSGKLVDDLRKAKSTIPADVLSRLLAENMATSAKGFVIAGFPNNMADAKQFELELKRKPAIVIFCAIPENEYLSRVQKKYGPSDEKVLKQNYAKEFKACEEVYKHYEKRGIKLVTTTPVSENNDRLMAGFKKMGLTDFAK